MVRRSEREMREALSRREGEGLSWSALREATGIPISTLQYWQRKLDASEDDRFPDFVELVVRGDTEGGRPEAEGFELVLIGGAVLRIPNNFDSQSLSNLLSVLNSVQC